MEIATAIKILQKEAEFLGLGFLETLEDIQKEGSMVYSERVMIAFRVFVREGAKMFAPA